MSIELHTIEPGMLSRYATVPIAFKVESQFRIEVLDQGLAGFRLVKDKVSPAYVKDYDTQSDDASPIHWPQQFDISCWGLFLAEDGKRPVGAAAVAINTPGVNMLEDRDDLAVLWDIRVHPDVRRHGLGTKLFQHATNWSREQGCSQLKVETQNINVPACRFYARQGCELGSIHRFGYAACLDVAHETMLLWYYDLR